MVYYGTVQDSLTFSSAEVTGSSDITSTNQVYSVQLNGLDSETDYFYQVVATNDVDSTASTIATFMTTIQGTYLYVKGFVHMTSYGYISIFVVKHPPIH